jgi:alpha-glucosidase
LPISDSWREFTVEVEEGDSQSSLNLYRASLAIRRSHPALAKSSDYRINWLQAAPGLVAFSRSPNFYLFANTTDHVKVVPVPESDLRVLLASGAGGEVKEGQITLPPHTTIWLDQAK